MLENEIVKLGLSEKEAKVYLASLELGPSPVQAIAQKSQVNRATTYVVIDGLMGMGLMSTYNEGKKTFFTAESPERLLEFLKNQEHKIQGRINILEETMPELKFLHNTKDNPKVRFYEGIEGLRTVQMEFVNTLKYGDVIYTFLPLDDFLKSNLQERKPDITKKRFEKGIRMKIIYTSNGGRNEEYEKQESKKSKEYLYIDHAKYPFNGGMNIYGNRILMIDYKGKMGGLVIENKTFADTFRSLFNALWDGQK